MWPCDGARAVPVTLPAAATTQAVTRAHHCCSGCAAARRLNLSLHRSCPYWTGAASSAKHPCCYCAGAHRCTCPPVARRHVVCVTVCVTQHSASRAWPQVACTKARTVHQRISHAATHHDAGECATREAGNAASRGGCKMRACAAAALWVDVGAALFRADCGQTGGIRLLTIPRWKVCNRLHG